MKHIVGHSHYYDDDTIKTAKQLGKKFIEHLEHSLETGTNFNTKNFMDYVMYDISAIPLVQISNNIYVRSGCFDVTDESDDVIELSKYMRREVKCNNELLSLLEYLAQNEEDLETDVGNYAVYDIHGKYPIGD